MLVVNPSHWFFQQKSLVVFFFGNVEVSEVSTGPFCTSKLRTKTFSTRSGFHCWSLMIFEAVMNGLLWLTDAKMRMWSLLNSAGTAWIIFFEPTDQTWKPFPRTLIFLAALSISSLFWKFLFEWNEWKKEKWGSWGSNDSNNSKQIVLCRLHTDW